MYLATEKTVKIYDRYIVQPSQELGRSIKKGIAISNGFAKEPKDSYLALRSIKVYFRVDTCILSQYS